MFLLNIPLIPKKVILKYSRRKDDDAEKSYIIEDIMDEYRKYMKIFSEINPGKEWGVVT